MRRSGVGRDGRKEMGGKGVMNKDPEVRRREESRTRQGLRVGYEGTSWEMRLQSYSWNNSNHLSWKG